MEKIPLKETRRQKKQESAVQALFSPGGKGYRNQTVRFFFDCFF